MQSKSERPIRLAVVGVGKIARDQHLPAIAANPAFDLVATASVHGSVDGLPSYENVEDLLAGGHALDAVSICTPPVGREATTIAALEAGLHVMLEKPPTATVEAAERLASLARGRQLSMFATWHSREAAAVDAAARWLASRRITRIAIEWREDIRRWHPGQDWILAPGGLGVFDPGINALSILTAIVGEPIRVERCELMVPQGREGPLSASLELRCGAAPALVAFDFLHTGKQRWDILVETDAGGLVLGDGGRTLTIAGELVKSGENREYPRMYDHFAELVRTGKSDVDLSPLRLVAEAQRIARKQAGAPFAW